MIDMSYFLFLVTLFIGLYFVMFFIQNLNVNDKGGLKGSFDESIMLLLAAGEPRDYDDPVFYVVFLLGILLIPIVMLNLLISIIGDSFDKVQQENFVQNYKELAGLVLEIEYLMVWNRSKVDAKYIYIIQKAQNNQNGVDWEGKMNYLKYHITQSKDEMN